MTNISHVTRLSFGRAIPTGGTVTDRDWQEFEAQHIARRFPDGFTVIHAEGGWKDTATGGLIREPTAIVEIAHGGSEEELRAIRIVARSYKLIFAQQAVMATTVPATVEFI